MSWAAVAKTVAMVGSAYLGSRGGEQSADAQVDANREAMELQREALRTQLALHRPYHEVGTSALSTLAALFGLQQPTTVNYDDLASGVGGRQQQFQPGQGLTNQQQQVVQSFTASFGFNPLSSPEQASRVQTSHFASDRHFDDYGAFQAAFGYDPLKREGNPFLDQSLMRQRSAQAQARATPAGLDFDMLVANNPMIRFNRQQGEQAIARGAAARGINESGGTLQDLAVFNQDLSSSGLQQFVMNPLFQLAGFGPSASGQMSGAAGATGTNLANLAQSSGAVRGSAYQNTGTIYGNLLGGISDAIGWGDTWGKSKSSIS